MSELKELKEKTRKLLHEHSIAVIASIAKDSPHQGLVAIVESDDLCSLFFATPVYTRKYENILKNTSVSLLADNRTKSELDFETYNSLTIKGKASVLSKETAEMYFPLFLTRHPYLEDFIHSPSSAFIRVDVEIYSLVSSFQHVQEWSPKP